ncbi:MAG TPA: aspartate aminotransferase family protein [Candidatus Omnitrophota bacterium]|nr:aspartate aminotransferase family protein [Candidatus Omnitrophota bacterium]
MKKNDILKDYDNYILSTYSRIPGIFVKGKGMDLFDIDGKKYLDFFPGWGVNNIGHCHPKVMAGVRDQVSKLIHVPNNFYHPNQVKLAKEIIRHAFPGKVFFGNSGAEACEAAIKFSRLYGKNSGRHEIITMKNSFHGRTLGALAATGQEKYQQGFHPLPEGFKCVAFNDIAALKSAVGPKTIAIMLELVQGEGGINIAGKDYIAQIRELCDQKDILLIFDEVQTGMGRTGTMFAFEQYNIKPDLMMLAKSLGGGLPIGVLVVKKSIADIFKPGMHASTFGGSPLVCKAALGAFKAIAADKMLKNVKVMGPYIMDELNKLKEKFSCITDVRGLGLMIGVQLNIEGKIVFEECFNNGLIINCTQGNILRLMPALTVTRKEANKALHILTKVLENVSAKEQNKS